MIGLTCPPSPVVRNGIATRGATVLLVLVFAHATVAAQSASSDTADFDLRKRVTFSVGNAFEIRITGRLEAAGRLPTPTIGVEAADIEWQDHRLGVEGTFLKRFAFQIERDLGGTSNRSNEPSQKTPWQDVYVTARISRAFEVTGGRFKLPFGRDALTSSANLDFVYRSLIGRMLAPGRDPGVAVGGRLWRRELGYEAGYFWRDGDNGRTQLTRGGNRAAVARVLARPLESTSLGALAPLEVGFAFERSSVDDRLGLRGRTAISDGVFFDRVFVNGSRRRRGFEAAWEHGPIALSAERITASDERRGMGFSGENLPTVNARGWYAAGTFTLTGERKRGWVEPRRPLFGGGLGAFEVGLRTEALHFDQVAYAGEALGLPPPSSFLANADDVTTFGVNWYLNRYVKVQFDRVLERIDDPSRSPAPDANGRFASNVFRLLFRL